MKHRMRLKNVWAYLLLSTWVLIVLFPIYTLLINSFKPQREIFTNPYALPQAFTLDGYQNAIEVGHFDILLRNSLIITSASLLLILLLGSLASYALANWSSRISNIIYLFFIIGLLIPIRLGTLGIIEIIIGLHLNNTLLGLIPIYVAAGIPISILVITAFIRGLPRELIDAAISDGASELQIYWHVILPLIRPALATVAIFNMIPIWNDFWWPLILLRQPDVRTIPLGVSLLFGEFSANWTNILSVLAMASLPMIVLYLLLASQFIKGMTAGAIKG